MPEEPKKPEPVDEPGAEPARPNFFTRLGAFFGMSSSKAKIATHAARTERAAAYGKYQTDVEEYAENFEEYQDNMRIYASKMSQYYNMRTMKDISNAGTLGRVETYELEHKAWEKENADREQLSAARDKSAKAIADALGNFNDPKFMKAMDKNLDKLVAQEAEKGVAAAP